MNILLCLTNKKSLAFNFIIFFLCGIIFFSISYFSISNIYNKLDLLKLKNTKTIFLSKYQLLKWHEYIYPGNSIKFSKIDNPQNPLRLEIIMQTVNANGFEEYLLGESEMVISKNAARELNIGIGDFLIGDLSYLNTGKKYRISGILDYFCGTYNNPLSDWGLILLGYDPGFESNINTKYIVFSDVEINKFDQNTLTAIDNLNSVIITTSFRVKLIWLSVFYHGIFFFLIIFMFFILKKLTGDFWSCYLAYFSQLGYSRSEMILSFTFMSFLSVFLPLIASYLMIIFFSKNIQINLNGIVIIFLLCILLTIIWIIMGFYKYHIQVRFKYGK